MDKHSLEDDDWGPIYSENKEVLLSRLYENFERAVEACRDMMLKLRKRAPVNQIAWYARNLLELQIWIEFCCRDRLNAEEFYEDAIRDLIDLNRSKEQHDEQLTRDLAKAQALIDKRKKPHEFRTTAKAAFLLGDKDKTTSWEEYFRDQNKLLSKFVHPTALSVVLPLPRNNVAAIQKQLVEAGEEYARDGLNTLRGSLLKTLHDHYEPLLIETERTLRLHGKSPLARAHFLQGG